MQSKITNAVVICQSVFELNKEILLSCCSVERRGMTIFAVCKCTAVGFPRPADCSIYAHTTLG